MRNTKLKSFALLMAGLTSFVGAIGNKPEDVVTQISEVRYVQDLDNANTLLMGQFNQGVSVGVVVDSNSDEVTRYTDIMFNNHIMLKQPIDNSILNFMPGFYMNIFTRTESRPSLLFFTSDGIVEVTVARTGTYSGIISDITNLIGLCNSSDKTNGYKPTMDQFKNILDTFRQNGNAQFTFRATHANIAAYTDTLNKV